MSVSAPTARENGLLLLVHHAHQMAHLADHAVHVRGVRQLAGAANLVEPETDQRLALIEVPAQRLATCSTLIVFA